MHKLTPDGYGSRATPRIGVVGILLTSVGGTLTCALALRHSASNDTTARKGAKGALRMRTPQLPAMMADESRAAVTNAAK
jgi:hypothetical protein